MIAEVYRRFPWYATRSEIVDKVLNDRAEIDRIHRERSTEATSGLFTIGYEGKSLEGYLNQLLREGVTTLCDVRRNPLSRKFGFSKGTLSQSCERVGIHYEHLPQLGIASEDRRNLKTQADYDTLFGDYENNSLPNQAEFLAQIEGWIQDGERVALTCFERFPQQCHRHCVTEAIERNGRVTACHL